MTARPNSTLLALALSLLASTAAQAAPTYMIAFNNGGAFLPENYSSTPFHIDTAFDLAPSNGTGTFTGGAFAGPGALGLYARIDCVWDGSSGAFWGKTRATTATDDFVISGPPNPSGVSGTLWLQVQFSLAKSGGYSGNGGHATAFVLNASTLYSGVQGSCTCSNAGLDGTGCFSGVGSPDVDMLVPLTGTYPVNQSFSINLYAEAVPATYGNVGTNPGMVQTNAGGSSTHPGPFGVRLLTSGAVMTLPAGYTLDSPNWGIVNNAWPATAGVGDAPMALGLSLSGANPTAGRSRLRLTLPHEAEVSVVVHDLAGRAIATLLAGRQAAGPHELSWEGRDAAGAAVPAGLYFVRAQSGSWQAVQRLVRVGGNTGR